MAAVERFEASAGDVLGVVLAVGQRDELVVPAPEDERGALDAPQVLRQAGVVQVRIPADAGGRFAGLEPLDDPRVVEAFGQRERNARVVRIFEEQVAELGEVVDEQLGHRSIRQPQAGRIDEDQLLDEGRAEDRQFDRRPAAEREADDGHAAELQLGQQIDVVPGVVGDVANLIEPLRIGKARMSRQIDGEVLGQLLVERHPLGLAAGGVQIEERRPLATDGELGFLAGDGGEVVVGLACDMPGSNVVLELVI